MQHMQPLKDVKVGDCFACYRVFGDDQEPQPYTLMYVKVLSIENENKFGITYETVGKEPEPYKDKRIFHYMDSFGFVDSFKDQDYINHLIYPYVRTDSKGYGIPERETIVEVYHYEWQNETQESVTVMKPLRFKVRCEKETI